MRLAHFSDIHVTRRLSGAIRRGELAGKRLIGALNYYAGGRRRHFAQVDARIGALLEDVDAQSPDHVLCTGDVTQMSYEEELDRCAALFGPRLSAPDRYTVLPGNHDRYTREAAEERWFESRFGSLAPDQYPAVKRIGDGVTMVLLDVSRPCSVLDSSGLCGERQLSKARAILTDPSLADQFVIVALHYALLRANGKPDRAAHGIRDWALLLELIDGSDARVDLVLHGHIHRHYQVKSAGSTHVCAGSATDLFLTCGYNLYDLDVERRTFTTIRRCWDPDRGAYVPAPSAG